MKHFLCLLSAFLLLPFAGGNVCAQRAGKYEVRAAWVATAYGLDWPRTKAVSPSSVHRQQEELAGLLDGLRDAGINTVLFQVRARGEVFYRSEVEAFSSVLTGRVGQDPGYDPLAFVIEQCHRRGMECHAWLVTIPLGHAAHVRRQGRFSPVHRRPKLCVAFRREYFLDPSQPGTADYLARLVREVVERYDVDGIHLDYLRYPEKADRFPDGRRYRQSGRGMALDEWRRDNITGIVRRLYREVKALKPWVKVSSSPIGKLCDTARYPSLGWNAYEAVYQDVERWLREGLQDQIYPMAYFRGDAFYPFVLDWSERANGRQVVPGLGVYFLGGDRGREWQLDDVARQVRFVRRNGLSGQAYYRAQFLGEDVKGVARWLRSACYPAPALVPRMAWQDSIAPAPASGLRVSRLREGYYRLEWQASVGAETEPGGVSYVVYASDTLPVDTDEPANIVAQGVRDTTLLYAPLLPWQPRRHFAVVAQDRCGNESLPCVASVRGL